MMCIAQAQENLDSMWLPSQFLRCHLVSFSDIVVDV